MDTELLKGGLQVAAFGMGGVFLVLILFYLCTKLLLNLGMKTKK